MKDSNFEAAGFQVVNAFLERDDCAELEHHSSQLASEGVGTRNLLERTWCANLVEKIRRHPVIGALLLADPVAVQCNYFEKSLEQNWLVPIHQDLSIPVKEKFDHPALRGWSEKEGSIYVQAPDDLLREMTSVRLHIDDCGTTDGALRVVKGSHLQGRIDNETALRVRDEFGETICPVTRGGVMVMKPLLLHASSKAKGTSKRRVLHFVFGMRNLPYGLKWQYAV
jgi:hypothetical protein